MNKHLTTLTTFSTILLSTVEILNLKANLENHRVKLSKSSVMMYWKGAQFERKSIFLKNPESILIYRKRYGFYATK